MLDNSGYTRGIKVAQFFSFAVIANKAGKGGDIFLGTIDFEIKIGFDLEGFAKIRISPGKGPIEIGIANDNDLSVGGNRFWSQTLRRDKSENRGGFLDLQPPVFDPPL